jgi:hypothetical protein
MVSKTTARSVEQNRMVELKFVSAQTYADPFNTVQLDAIVTEPDGTQLRVPGFWAGGEEWRVRYASGKVGQHACRTECSDADNEGLHGATGEIEVTPYAGDNLLYRHGPLRVAGDRRRFAHADGTPFFWLGDTWWMGLCRRLRTGARQPAPPHRRGGIQLLRHPDPLLYQRTARLSVQLSRRFSVRRV